MPQDLIFDLGLHRGEDTAYYLARGFRVVAVEADPDLVAQCGERFRAELGTGQLAIVHGAIVEDDARDSVTFYKNTKLSVWGTVVKGWADRNAALGAASTEITVPVADLPALFARHGCPHYLKIDIEGMDLVCLRKLLKTPARPTYVSLESEKVDFAALQAEFDTFEALGYRRFQLVQQENIMERRVPPGSTEGRFLDHRFEPGSSGPFGADLGEGWIGREEALARYRSIFREYRWFGDASLLRRLPKSGVLLRGLSRALGRPLPGWYDTHARHG